jgi:VanZ family protein
VLALALNPTYKGGWLLKTFGDKVLHASAFTVGSLVWAKALETTRPFRNLWSVVVGAVVALIVGAAIEILQIYVPGRSPDFKDFVADCVGVLPSLVYLTIVGLNRYRKSGRRL